MGNESWPNESSDAAPSSEERAGLANLVDDLAPRAIRLLVRLGIPDRLAAGPCSIEDLAKRTDTQPGALGRLLRYLAGRGVLIEVKPDTFALSRLGQPLRSDREGSLQPFLTWSSEPDVVTAWGDFSYSLRTGRSAYEHHFGRGPFQRWAAQPEGRRAFDAFMASRSKELLGIVTGYDWSDVDVLVDVGGGTGTILTSALVAWPNLRGVLVDLPGVVEDAAATVREAGVESRCEVVGADFFEEVPSGGDRYLLASILHDWDDRRAVDIVGSCRRAMKPTGRLLIIECVLPRSRGFHPALSLDLVMLVIFGGRERTEDELESLLADGGFRTCGSRALSSSYRLIEAALA
jgi:hypothetical protein